MTSTYTLIDTFPEFELFWERAQHLSLDDQISAWANNYMSSWPELLQIQIENYEDDGYQWQAIAREHVFPDLDARYRRMETAHMNLLKICEPLWQQVGRRLALEFPLTYVIYVGIGCGAGWAAEYQGNPAVLLGLENIAQEGWQGRDALEGLLAHEIGHLAHFYWRDSAGIGRGEGPWWDLYSEGFAQYCEHFILGTETWHMAADAGSEWLDWCRANTRWLAEEYLRAVEADEPLQPFFGSWYDLKGFKQTGYFLGHEVVRIMVESQSLNQVGVLGNLGKNIRNALERLAKG